MDDTYLVEIRLGRTKWRIREMVTSIAQTYSIEDFREKHPHVTLFGPFMLRDNTGSRDLLRMIADAAAPFGPVGFTIGEWEMRKGMHGSVIAFTVSPSEELRALTTAIAGSLVPRVVSANVWDGQPDKKWFHVTIANRLDPAIGARVFSGLSGTVITPEVKSSLPSRAINALRDLFSKAGTTRQVPVFHPPLLDETGLRITVMRGEHIYAEYDFLEKRWVMNGHDHDSHSWQRTLLSFRQSAGYEKRDPATSHPGTIFVISDMHLGHANIIRYCSRPFLYSDIREMDHVLIKNWNYTVSSNDQIFHLGDLRYGRETLPLRHYRKKLHGNVTFIAGNHDEEELGAVPSVRLEYEGRDFLFIHDPAEVPPSYEGWVIHGHHHNNDLRNYPFMNFIDRHVNVSVEVIGYCPVSLDEIAHQIRERELSGNTTPILLRNSDFS